MYWNSKDNSFALHLYLRSKDEHEIIDHNFIFHFLIFTSRYVEQLRTWHLWFQSIQLLGEQKYKNKQYYI